MIKQKVYIGHRIFTGFNIVFLLLLSAICILPLINVLAISLSSSMAASAGWVKLWPVDFTLKSYQFVTASVDFIQSFWVSTKRLMLGIPFNMLLTVLVAYPLSKEKQTFRMRTFFVWFFMITTLFGGGLIPTYMIIRQTGLIDSIWALILPSAVPVFNIILLLNFFRELPKELEEAVFIDGAGHFKSLWTIYIPLSKPALATLTLFVIVGHWNAWFDGLIYMNSPKNYPLQSYLQTVLTARDPRSMSPKDIEMLKFVNDRTSKAAQIFVSLIPVLLIYPFLQKYFTTGIVLGSVKG